MMGYLLPLLLTFVPLTEFPDGMKSYLGQEVEIKGFLYAGPEGWILTDQPHLKSCCAGKSTKKITVSGKGLVPSPDQIVALTGTLSQSQSGYLLSDAQVIERAFPWMWIAGGLLAVLIGYGLRRKFHHRDTEAQRKEKFR